MWSLEQKNIFKQAKKHQHLLINADAGSGKSTVLFGLMEIFDAPSLLLSFNQDIKLENARKAKKKGFEHVEVRTFHGWGMSLFPKEASKKIDFRKVEKYLETEMGIQGSEMYVFAKFLHEIRGRGMHGYTPEAVRNFCENCEDYGLQRSYVRRFVKNEQDYKSLGMILLDLDGFKGKIKSIDFDDMCRLPNAYTMQGRNWINPKVLDTIDIIYCDEIQDLNKDQWLLIQHAIKAKPSLKVIGVGDKKQAIYGFRGAIESFDRMAEILDNPIEMPLTTTYRVPERIVQFVNKQIEESNMTAHKSGGTLVLERAEDPADKFGVETWIGHNPDMVIATRNSTLISIWISLLLMKKEATLKGSGIIPTLISMAKSIPTYDWRKFRLQLRALANEGKRSKKFDQNADIAVGLLEIIDRLYIDSKHMLMDTLEKMKLDKSGIMLETVWSSKGREANTIVGISSYWTKEQLMQQRYVMMTRPLEKLIMIKPYGE